MPKPYKGFYPLFSSSTAVLEEDGATGKKVFLNSYVNKKHKVEVNQSICGRFWYLRLFSNDSKEINKFYETFPNIIQGKTHIEVINKYLKENSSQNTNIPSADSKAG